MYIKCHVFGDQYRATDTVLPGSRKLKLVFVLDKHDEKKERFSTLLVLEV